MNLYKRCLDKWGVDKQICQSMGECGEFIADAQNYRRNKIPLQQLLTEAAHVHIMMMQMRELDTVLFDAIVEQTINRVEGMLNK